MSDGPFTSDELDQVARDALERYWSAVARGRGTQGVGRGRRRARLRVSERRRGRGAFVEAAARVREGRGPACAGTPATGEAAGSAAGRGHRVRCRQVTGGEAAEGRIATSSPGRRRRIVVEPARTETSSRCSTRSASARRRQVRHGEEACLVRVRRCSFMSRCRSSTVAEG